MIRDGDFTAGNCLNYEYFSTWYKLIVIDLSKQKADLENQQINFIGKLEQDVTIFFIVEEKHQTGLEFSKILCLLYKNGFTKNIKLVRTV